MNKDLIFLSVGLVYTIACSGCEGDMGFEKQEELDAIPIVINTGLVREAVTSPRAPVSIDKAEINGDILKMTVSFTGGCEEHTFRLVASEGYDKTNPPGAHVSLIHDAAGDTCTEQIKIDLRFDLTPLKEYFQGLGVHEVHFRVRVPPSYRGSLGVFLRYKF